MGKPTEVMDRFFAAMSDGDLDRVATLIHDDFDFAGPVAGTKGADAYLGMLRQFGCSGMRFDFHARFEDGDEVCAIYDMTMDTPAGRPLTLTIADRARVRDGRLARQRILYDPRPMLMAFGMDPATTFQG